MNFMKKIFLNLFLIIFTATNLCGCARDLSNTTYTSDSTLNVVLEGIILSKRNVKIKESERLGDNTTGAAVGALGTGALLAGNSNDLGVVIGGAVVGGVIGSIAQSALSSNNGVEYIVKVDTSKMDKEYYEGSRLMRNAIAAVRATGIVTVVQSKQSKKEVPMSEGQNVLLIISEKRTRVIPNPHGN